MIESPVLKELQAEWTARGKAEGKAEAILRILRARLGDIPEDVEAEVLAL
jgi:hypothetical protein